jgi:hypothetical protein
VRQICTENSEIGEVSVRSRLRSYGFNVQRARVCAAIKSIVGHFFPTPKNHASGVLCPSSTVRYSFRWKPLTSSVSNNTISLGRTLLIFILY